MAYNTSYSYKRRIYADSSNSYLRIYLNDVLINNDYVRDFDFDDGCFEGDSFTLGSAVIQKIVLKLDNDCLPFPVEEITKVKIDYGLQVYDNSKIKYSNQDILFAGEDLYFEDKGIETIEWIPIGVYDIGKDPDTSSSDYTTFTLYDYMNRLDTGGYDGSSIIPCTRYELAQDMCRKCNLELGSESFLGGDKMVYSYDNSINPKTYFSFLSERAGGYAKAGRDGKIYIKSFIDVDVMNLTETECESANINNFDILKTITKVTYEDATNKWEFGNNDGLQVFLSSENPFAIDEEEVLSIYNSLLGLTFQSADIKMWGDPSYDAGDIICVRGVRTFIQPKWKYNNGFYGNYKTTLKESNTISNVEKVSSEVKLRRVKSILNEVTGEIDIITERVDGNESDIAEIKADLGSITLKVEETSENLESNYLNKDQIDAISSTNNENIELLKKAVEQKISASDLTITVQREIANGVSSIRTNTGYTFDDNGLNISKEGEEMNNTLDNTGMFVKRDNDEVLGADATGVRTENLKVRKYLEMGLNSRFEDYKQVRTACFFVGGAN